MSVANYKKRSKLEGERNAEIRGYLNQISDLERQVREGKDALAVASRTIEDLRIRSHGDDMELRYFRKLKAPREQEATVQRMSDAELVALAAFVTTEHQLPSPARDRLAEELQTRKITTQITGKWEKAEPLLKRLAELHSTIAVVGYSERPKKIVEELISLVTP